MLDDNRDDTDPTERPLRPLPSEDAPSEPAWLRGLGGAVADDQTEPPSSAAGPAEDDADEAAEQPWLAGLGEARTTSFDPVEPDDDPHHGTDSRRVSIRALAVGAGALAVVGLLAGFAFALFGGSGDEEDAGAGEQPLTEQLAEAGVISSAAPTSAAAEPTTPPCESKQEGTVVFGDGPGDTESTAGVVLAFQYAYYEERSAESAFELAADESAFTDSAALQEGIDSVPEGTSHCLEIRPTGDTSALVIVTEARPGVAPQKFNLEAKTERDDDGEVRLVWLREAES